MSTSEKIALASCILLVVFLSTNAMLLPLLRGRRDRGRPAERGPLDGLLRGPVSKDAEAMRELARQVEKFRQQERESRPDQTGPPEDS
jgi:hypothetical protein